MPTENAADASASRPRAVRGAPVLIGFPESIGIADLAKPDFGDAVPIEPDELPVPMRRAARLCPISKTPNSRQWDSGEILVLPR